MNTTQEAVDTIVVRLEEGMAYQTRAGGGAHVTASKRNGSVWIEVGYPPRESQDDYNRRGWTDFFVRRGVPYEVVGYCDGFTEMIESAVDYLVCQHSGVCRSCGCELKDNGKPNCSQCGAPKGG